MRVVTALLVALAVCSTAWAAAVSPTTREPAALLAVRPENQPLIDVAAKVYVQVRETVTELNSKRDQNQFEAIRGEVVGQAYAGSLKLLRIAERLKLAAEPAGVDLGTRATDFILQINGLIEKMKTSPKVREGLVRTFTAKVLPLATKQQKQIPTLEKLCAANQWDEAEEKLYAILDELEEYGCWYERAEREKVFFPFGPATRTIAETLTRKRREEAEQRMEALRMELKPELDAWLQQATAVAASISQTGQAALDGNQLSGPAALAHLVKKLQAAQVAGLRRRAVEWSMAHIQSRTNPEVGLIETEFLTKSPQVLQRLAALIEADASRAGAPEAESLYKEYLLAVAGVSGLFPERALVTATQPALQHLVAKSPDLVVHVQAYERATGDLMRWRKRAAAAQAKARGKDYPQVAAKLAEASVRDGAFRGMGVSGSNLGMAMLTGDADSVVTRWNGMVVGANVQLGEVRATEDGAHACTRYEDRLSTRISSAKQSLAGYLPLLEYDLLSSAAAPPLTLAATIALEDARRGNLVAAGGRIEQVGLVGLIPRFLAPSPENLESLRLGPLPVETVPGVSSLCVECELKPTWIQHELLFVPLE